MRIFKFIFKYIYETKEMIYLKSFKTYNDYEEYINNDPILPNVSTCDDEPNGVHYNPYKEKIKALKFTANGASTLGLANENNTPNLEYSRDGNIWTTWDYSTLNIADGESVYIRGNNPDGFSKYAFGQYSSFVMSGSIACEGNVMHLMDYTQDLLETPLRDVGCLCHLFDSCTSLTTAPELPATKLNGFQSYSRMFKGCTSLTKAPELPATKLNLGCYAHMFEGCVSLTTTPELPANTLKESCYGGMFEGCVSITTAPELPANTLEESCYDSMFEGCSSLNSITMLATTNIGWATLRNWVDGVSSTGTFTKKSGVTIESGISGIPEGWTIVEV